MTRKAPWTLDRLSRGPDLTWVPPLGRSRTSTIGVPSSRATTSARTLAWLYPRRRRRRDVVGTGITKDSLATGGHTAAMRRPISSPRRLQPLYFRAWTRASAGGSITTAARAETRISGQSAHSRQVAPAGCPVPCGTSQRGQRGGGGARRRVRHRAQTGSWGSSGGSRSPHPKHPRGRMRSRKSATSDEGFKNLWVFEERPS